MGTRYPPDRWDPSPCHQQKGWRRQEGIEILEWVRGVRPRQEVSSIVPQVQAIVTVLLGWQNITDCIYIVSISRIGFCWPISIFLSPNERYKDLFFALDMAASLFSAPKIYHSPILRGQNQPFFHYYQLAGLSRHDILSPILQMPIHPLPISDLRLPRIPQKVEWLLQYIL